MSSESRKRMIELALDTAYYAFVLWALWFLFSPSRPPLRPWFWHTLQKWCQKSAYRIGRVGIHAEKAYGVAIERVRQ